MDINFDSPHSTPSLLFSDFKSKLNIPPTRGSTVDVNRFGLDGFSDFELDLGCLSRSPSPSSPAAASFSSDLDGPSRPASPSSPTVSTFSPTPPSQAINITSAKISPKTAATVIRASWPALNRYVGRGTPVDPTRRSQWGGYEAAEDGRLHSGTLRSTSLDSAIRASGPAHRSASPDWHHVSSESPVQPFVLPEESKIQFDVQQSDPSEWDAFMHTVLSQTSTGSAPSGQPSPPRTPDLDIDLGLDAALDLGLGLGRVYSSPPGTPRGSRQVSLDNSATGFVPGPPPSQFTVNGNGNGNGCHDSKLEERTETKSFYGSGTEAWWRKLIEKLRRLQKLLHRRKVVHSN
ncbi:hypothetical protein BDZ89DRAFT_1055912 [Hymenopellis radicata]|nr:hypothetical protein BDZ89DRAFT_1055912 [Hymenopellis radicata]